MDNFFRIELKNICAHAIGSEQEIKEAMNRCAKLNLSEREELILNAIFDPTPEDVLLLLDLYETYLPYLRGATGFDRAILDYESATRLDFFKDSPDQVEYFGMLLRSVFLWQGNLEYQQVAREVVRKLSAFTDNTFEYDELLGEYWGDVYYRLTVLIFAENLPALEELTQLLFLGSKMFFSAIMLGIDMEERVGAAIDYFVFLALRADLATNFATFLYANDQNIGFNPETNEAVKLSFWIDRFRIYSEKKFDGLSLMNFVQDNTVWGDLNDDLVRMTIKKSLMIYGHLVSGYYVFPQIENEIPVYNKKNKDKLNKETNEVSNFVESSAKNSGNVVTTPDLLEIKRNILDSLAHVPEEDRVVNIVKKLNELAEKYQDQSIMDLYYFDEQIGEFKWRV